MTSATRLESLLLLLTSPQSKAQLARRSDDVADRFSATAWCASNTALHSCSGQQADATHVASVFGEPPKNSSGAHSPSGTKGGPLGEQDINAELSPDMLCRGKPASCEAAAAACMQQPAHSAAAYEGGTACRQLVTVATPQPRQTDARAVPTAKHPAPAVWHSLRHSNGMCIDLGHAGEGAGDAPTSPGERRRWEQRIGTALQRAQVWTRTNCIKLCGRWTETKARCCSASLRRTGVHRLQLLPTCLMIQVAEAAAAEARWQADAAADRERQLAGQLAAAQSAQRRAEQQLGQLQASIEQVRTEY